MEENECETAPNGKIEDKGQQSLICACHSGYESSHTISHRSVIQNHENDSEKGSQVVLENEETKLIFQESEDHIKREEYDHGNDSELVSPSPDEKDDENITYNQEEHAAPGDYIRISHYKRRQGQQFGHIVDIVLFVFVAIIRHP